MITTSSEARLLQTGADNPPASLLWQIRVESWYAGRLLHDDIPVVDAVETSDRTSSVPERLTITVPIEDLDGYRWAPDDDDLHPLAPYGQRLHVLLGIEVRRNTFEWIQRGEYLITRATPDGDQVRVEAVGLLGLIEEARLVAPYRPSGTFKSTLRGLLEPALTVLFDAALTDRSVPSGINFDEDRIGAVQEVLNAWPAEMRMDGQGFLRIYPPVTPSFNGSIASFQDYVIDVTGEVDRDDAVNCVVARGTASDGGQLQGVAYLNSGPHRYGGPFNRLAVPEFYASPLLTTVAQCRTAAQTRLRRLATELRRPLKVLAPPMTFLQIGDVVTAGRPEVTSIPCTVEAITLPLMPGQNTAMELTLAGDPDA